MRKEHASCSLERDSHDQPRGELEAAVGNVDSRFTPGVTQPRDANALDIAHPFWQESAEQDECV